jgi:uncharacterized membrane protein
MNKLFISLYSWENGAVIMVGVFALVIIAFVVIFFFMIKNYNKKKND